MSQVGEAVVVWTGYGSTPSPSRDEQRLVDRFGAEMAADLLPQVRALEEDFYASDANHTVQDLAKMGEVAAVRFRELHPDVLDEAVQAFIWCYTFDYK